MSLVDSPLGGGGPSRKWSQNRSDGMASEEEDHALKRPWVGHGTDREDDIGSVLLYTHFQLNTHVGSVILWAWQILYF